MQVHFISTEWNEQLFLLWNDNVFVFLQNGTLLQGLAIWKANLDKHFAGMEDCMICFSVIHHSNQSLPRLTCKTCKKKFHNICLVSFLEVQI